MYGKMQASQLTELIPFICNSAIWSQSCFLVHLKEWQMAASCISPAPQQSPQVVAASARSQFWEPSFTFGSQKSLMAVPVFKSLNRVRLFATPWTLAYQAPLSIGILQARTLEWVAMPFSRGTSQPRDQTQVSCIASGFFTG